MFTAALSAFPPSRSEAAQTPAAAADPPPARKVGRSATRTTVLLELFSSEGCSSCPLADAWLSRTFAGGSFDGRVVPLAFHVDYWNEIGWVDPFSQPRFTARQRDVAQRSGGQLYTPETALGGREWRDRGDLEAALAKLAVEKPRADLVLEAAPLEVGGSTLHAELKATARGAVEPMLYLALYENGLVVDVRSGENSGRTLRHDFVVRELVGPVAASKLSHDFAVGRDWDRARLGLAAFVEDGKTHTVLQSVSLSL